MSGKHTPGPWRVRNEETISVLGADNARVALTLHVHLTGRRDTSEVEANGRLIAAAPDLLAAATAAAEYIESIETGAGIARLLRAAIAKAEGTP